MSLPTAQTVDRTTQPNRASRVRKFGRRAIITYLLIVLGMMFLETRLVYPIPPLTRHNWKPTNFEYEDVYFASADGTKLNAWFFPNPKTKRAVLYCHGNGEDIAADGDLCSHLSNSRILNANVLVFDYRGYGHSEGSPTEAGCIADGDAAQKWLANRVGIHPNEVILMGRSLGSAVATALAADNGCRALILENSMPSIVSVAAQQYPWLPVKWVMRNRYDNLERIKRYDGPFWQSHGTVDTLIPIASARTLFDAAPSKNKRWIEYPNSDHNDPRPRKYYDELAAFLTTLDAPAPTLQPAGEKSS
ncbi:MAG TPA: alpha/beta hydrolase [Lacipirellulaceae bacterium]|jgi:hypothetical protein|nr:alpha/beta hydrolase [Lacipirellulaceae bacterium]